MTRAARFVLLTALAWVVAAGVGVGSGPEGPPYTVIALQQAPSGGFDFPEEEDE